MTWKKPPRTVRNTETKAMNAMVHGPHRKSDRRVMSDRKASYMRIPPVAAPRPLMTGSFSAGPQAPGN